MRMVGISFPGSLGQVYKEKKKKKRVLLTRSKKKNIILVQRLRNLRVRRIGL